MLKRLIAYVLGHLRIRVAGGRLEQFLNLALAHGLNLWEIEPLGDQMRASLTIRDFRRIRPVARESRCRVRILRRYGLPFKLARLWRRPLLIFGAIACLGFLFWASGHVWVIQVKTSEPHALDPRAVAAVAAEAGLRTGAWKNQIKVNQVQQHIQQRMAEVSWAIVRLQGTRAVIEVVEKVSPGPAAISGCVHLVARKAGVVEKVVPFQGEPVVRRGDVVRPGEMLVECAFRYYQGGRPLVFPGTPLPPRDGVARLLIAQASVKARVAYQQLRTVPFLQQRLVPTGRRQTRWVLNWKDQPILRLGNTSTDFDRSIPRQQTYPPASWRNWFPPVELVMLSIEEVETRHERITVATALARAREQLETELKWALSPSDQLLSPVRAELIASGPDFAEIRVTAETLEEIAVPQPGAGP